MYPSLFFSVQSKDKINIKNEFCQIEKNIYAYFS